MRDVLPEIEKWRSRGCKVAVATVVKVWGSAPRPLGAKMAVSSGGEMAGSVSGGCVEGAVFEEAQGAIESGEPRRVSFGVSDDEAWAAGLSCGGEIEIFVEALAEAGDSADLLAELSPHLEAERLVAVATVVGGPGLGRRMLIRPGGETSGVLGSPEVEEAALAAAEEAWKSFAARRLTVSSAQRGQGEVDLFVEVHPPPPKLVIVGAVHVAIPLVSLAKILGFRTVVLDPRAAFATPERFAEADELIVAWPDEALPEIGLHEGTYIASLSHDPKIDLPAIELALASPVRYIGALGSKKTHAKRVKALKEKGLSGKRIERIHAPIGLDLGGREAEEIALAVIAEIVRASHGLDGGLA